MSKYRILSLDGGPGNATYLRLLREIEKARPGFIDRTDLFGGTSDGAISSLCLAGRPHSEDGLTRIENTIALSDQVYLSAQPRLFGWLRLLTGFLSMDSNAPLKKLLQETLGVATKLGDLPRKVCLVSYKLQGKSGPKIYHNFADDQDCDQSVVDIALASSAFPVLLPIHTGHIDGAIFANNPSMCALTQAMSQKNDLPRLSSIEDVSLFSLGGDDQQVGTRLDQFLFNKIEELQWGWLPWLLQPLSPLLLIDLLINSSGRGISFQCRQILEERFMRLAPSSQTEIQELLKVITNRSKKVLKQADKTVAEWRDNPTGTTLRPNFDETMAWVDREWMAD